MILGIKLILSITQIHKTGCVSVLVSAMRKILNPNDKGIEILSYAYKNLYRFVLPE